MCHALVDDTRYVCRWNIDYVRAQQRVLQFGYLELKVYRGVDSSNLFLSNSDVGLSNRNRAVIENLV